MAGIEISMLGLAVTVGSALVGGGIGWGVMRSTLGNTVKRLEAGVTKIENVATDVTTLNADMAYTKKAVQEIKADVEALQKDVTGIKIDMASKAGKSTRRK